MLVIILTLTHYFVYVQPLFIYGNIQGHWPVYANLSEAFAERDR